MSTLPSNCKTTGKKEETDGPATRGGGQLRLSVSPPHHPPAVCGRNEPASRPRRRAGTRLWEPDLDKWVLIGDERPHPDVYGCDVPPRGRRQERLYLHGRRDNQRVPAGYRGAKLHLDVRDRARHRAADVAGDPERRLLLTIAPDDMPAAAASRSQMRHRRATPLSSKYTSRMPSVSSVSDTMSGLLMCVLPSSMTNFLPGRRGLKILGWSAAARRRRCRSCGRPPTRQIQ